jgi:hypothetical protein
MKLNRRTSFVLVSLALMFAGKQASAQNASGQPFVTILSETDGTMVRLEGAFTFIGKTPFTVSQNLAGPYKLIAMKRGYETQKIAVEFERNAGRQITVGLQPLSPGKAMFSSLLLPGAGQRYKGANQKGLAFTALALGAGARAYLKHGQFRDDRDAAANAGKKYLQISATEAAEQKLALEQWQKAQREADDSFKSRRRALMLTGAVWTINVLDALIASPGPAHPAKKDKVGVNVTSRTGTTPELGLRITF